ncbi:hypothetical protein pb186bvf_002052 [Paramecium bursaria]
MILYAIKAHHSRRLLTILILTHSYNLLLIVIPHLASVYPKHFIKIITNKLLFYLLFNENFISNLFIIYIEEFILSSFGRFIRLFFTLDLSLGFEILQSSFIEFYYKN